MTDAPDLLEAGLAAMRAQAEQDALGRIAAGADAAARHALARFDADAWRSVDFAEALLVGSRMLRQAGRKPSPAVVAAMERCAAVHRDGTKARSAVRTDLAVSAAIAPLDTINDEGIRPARATVGLVDVVQGVKARRP